MHKSKPIKTNVQKTFILNNSIADAANIQIQFENKTTATGTIKITVRIYPHHDSLFSITCFMYIIYFLLIANVVSFPSEIKFSSSSVTLTSQICIVLPR